MDMSIFKYPIGTRVEKRGEDSYFEGVVVAVFVKRNGKTYRWVVENDDGIVHIASERQLTLWVTKPPPVQRPISEMDLD